jgi:hypothetical protein
MPNRVTRKRSFSIAARAPHSRYQLGLAARARELCDQGTDMAAACRIIVLEDQLDEALAHNQRHHTGRPRPWPPTSPHRQGRIRSPAERLAITCQCCSDPSGRRHRKIHSRGSRTET